MNTVPGASHSGEDELATPGQLAGLLDLWEFTGRRDGDDAELEAIRELRGRLRRLWTATEVDVVAEVNDMLEEAHAMPQLVRHDAWDWHLHATSADSALVSRIAVESSMAIVDLVRSGELSRLGLCAADDCDGVLVDLSRNRSKRFCDTGNCGNRVHVAAYRARLADRD